MSDEEEEHDEQEEFERDGSEFDSEHSDGVVVEADESELSPRSPRGDGAAYDLLKKWTEKLIRLKKDAGERKYITVKTIMVEQKLPSHEDLEQWARFKEYKKKARKLSHKIDFLSNFRRMLHRQPFELTVEISSHFFLKQKAWPMLTSQFSDPFCNISTLELLMEMFSEKTETKVTVADMIPALIALKNLKNLKLLSLTERLKEPWLLVAPLTKKLERLTIDHSDMDMTEKGLQSWLDVISQCKLKKLAFNIEGSIDKYGCAVLSSLGALDLKCLKVCLDVKKVADKEVLAKLLAGPHIESLALMGKFGRILEFCTPEIMVSSAVVELELNSKTSFSWLASLPRLRRLHMKNRVFLSAAKCRSLAEGIRKSNSLVALNLGRYTSLQDEGFLAHALLQSAPRVQELEARPTASLLFGISNLSSVSLNEFRVPDALHSVFEKSISNQFLTTLKLFSMRVSGQHLLAGIAAAPNLQHVKLSNIKHEFLKPKHFEPLSRIPRLSLCLGRFSHRIVSHVLMHNSTIVHLSLQLSEENMDDDEDGDDERERAPTPKDQKRLVHALGSCSNLRRVKLGLNFSPSIFKKYVETSLSTLAHLRFLDVSLSFYEWDGIEEEPDSASLVKLLLLPQVKELRIFNGFLELATTDLTVEALKRNNMEKIIFEDEVENDDIDAFVDALWGNSKLISIAFPEEVPTPLTARNKHLRRNCRAACLTLIGIRLFFRSEAGMDFIPKEVVRQMAEYLWSTRNDLCWLTEVEFGFYESWFNSRREKKDAKKQISDQIE